MIQAIWNDVVIAESDDTVIVEGNHYFPRDSVNSAYVRPSNTETVCGWKGTASYYDVVVDDDVNADAAWYYAKPKPDAASIQGRVAFWKGVEIRE